MKVLSVQKPIERNGKWVVYYMRKTRKGTMKCWFDFPTEKVAVKKYDQLIATIV